MPAELEIHAASDAERTQVYRDTYDIWGLPGLSLDEHIKRRMSCPQHNRAEWFVGCVDGEQASSIAVYPLQYRLRGEVVSGIAIGSVHTVPNFRGRGFAPKMLEYSEHHARSRGDAVSLLFSDIDPGFYARLGYQECRSKKGWIELDSAIEQSGSGNAQFVEFSHDDDPNPMRRLYEAFHVSYEISIERGSEYWEFLGRKSPCDSWCWLMGSDGSLLGYARLDRRKGDLALNDWALADQTDETMRSFVAALLYRGRVCGTNRVGGWLPDDESTRAAFPTQSREIEITMLKALQPGVRLAADVLAAAHHFREIDHV